MTDFVAALIELNDKFKRHQIISDQTVNVRVEYKFVVVYVRKYVQSSLHGLQYTSCTHVANESNEHNQ